MDPYTIVSPIILGVFSIIFTLAINLAFKKSNILPWINIGVMSFMFIVWTIYAVLLSLNTV